MLLLLPFPIVTICSNSISSHFELPAQQHCGQGILSSGLLRRQGPCVWRLFIKRLLQRSPTDTSYIDLNEVSSEGPSPLFPPLSPRLSVRTEGATTSLLHLAAQPHRRLPVLWPFAISPALFPHQGEFALRNCLSRPLASRSSPTLRNRHRSPTNLLLADFSKHLLHHDHQESGS